MQVNFFATFRTAVGSKTVEFDLPGNATAKQLLEAIVAKYPALQKRLLDENNRLLPYVHVMINGKDLQLSPLGLQTSLAENDRVDIFPPVAGG